MPSLPAALTLLATGAAVTGAVAVTAVVLPGQGGPPGSTVATVAGPRPDVTVLPTRSPAGVPPGPVGDLASIPAAPPAAPAPPAAAAAPPTGASGRTGGGFAWPVRGTVSVLRRFAPGPRPWSPGHRGVDLVGTGGTVLAAGPGRVAFAGVIAGRGVVVVEHEGGLRTTYEPVTSGLMVGQPVDRGDPIGSVQAGAQHCPAGPCLHWGARIGERYLNPLSLLGGIRRPPVLLPLRGSPT